MIRLINYPFWRGSVFLSLGAVGLATGSWVADRTPPTVVLSATQIGQVVPGGQLRVRYIVERYRSCAFTVDRVLFDGKEVRLDLPDLTWKAAPGPLGRDEYTVLVDIPDDFAPGPSIYRTVISYECNVLHKLWPIITRGEVRFEVL